MQGGGYTFAPRFANSNAIPAPIPRDAPVTIAVLPCKGRYGGVVVALILSVYRVAGERRIEGREKYLK